jgi:putative transcriptional regulator
MNEIKIIKIQVNLSNPTTFPKGFVDKSKLDATTEEQIMLQENQDDLEWECFVNHAPKL